ncbi:11784_t:CDS:1, partial [Racocetra fulgida]
NIQESITDLNDLIDNTEINSLSRSTDVNQDLDPDENQETVNNNNTDPDQETV